MEFACRYSVVLPAFRKESSISDVISSIHQIFSRTQELFEIILVCDGEIDRTAEIARGMRLAELRILSYSENRGKGYAIRQGCEVAQGEILVMTDADMDLAHERIQHLIKLLEENKADLVVGSKMHPDSKVQYPPFRRALSFCYRILIRVLFKLKISDTQTGMKVAKNHSMRLVLNELSEDGFAGDLEVIIAFHRNNMKIIEGPITLNYQFSTTVGILSVLKMMSGTFRIFLITSLGKRRNG
jgi:dolichol-phosphate mannosyltransferase